VGVTRRAPAPRRPAPVSALATAAALSSPASGQATPEAPSGAPAIHADDAVRYRVEIAAPDAVADAVRGAVDLVRWQNYEDMTEDLFDRLARDAVPQAREAAAAQGFFSADVDVRVDRPKQPVTVAPAITPGAPPAITKVADERRGPIRRCSRRHGGRHGPVVF